MTTVVTYCKRFAGLLAIWVVALAALALWPGSPQGQTVHTGTVAIDGPETHLGADALFSHTGLWVSVTDDAGNVAYVRELRRR